MPGGAGAYRAYRMNRRAGSLRATRHLRQKYPVSTALYRCCLSRCFPCSTDLLNHAVWQAGVIQVIRLFAAVFVCPVKELQHFSTLLRLLLLFVDQNEGGRRDRPCIVAFLVGQVLREGFAPVSAFCGVSEVLFGRANRFAVSRNQFGVSQVVLLRVSVLYVADRARQTLYEGSDTVVAFTAQTVGQLTVEPEPTLDFTLRSLSPGSW